MASDNFNPYQAPLSTEAPPPQIDSGRPGDLADRWARLVAIIIDSMISLTIVLFCVGVLELLPRYWSEQQSWLEATVFGMLEISIHYLLNGYLLATRGQTIGKLILGIQIVNQETGKLISMTKMVLLRDLPITLPAVVTALFTVLGEQDFGDITILLLLIIDGLFIFTASRRCLHDRIANTKVIRIWS